MTRRPGIARLVASLSVVVLLLGTSQAATAQSPSIMPSASAAPSVVPSPTPTPLPSPPADLQLRAIHQERGIRVVVELDRNPMPAGETTRLRTTVTNIGRRDLIWFHDGCAIPVGVSGTMPGTRWREGLPFTAGDYLDPKTRLLFGGGKGEVGIGFFPKGFPTNTEIGCDDIGISDRLAPGEQLTMRHRWDGTARLRMGLPPPGPVTLDVWAGYFWRPGRQPKDIQDAVIRFTMPAWIVDGRDPTLLDPGEIVDAAFADPAFVTWYRTADAGMNEAFWYDEELGVWEIGALDHDTRILHLAHVDPWTGAILEYLDRPWDPKRDGYPG